MANRTQIVCLHEGLQGRSIDPVFFNALIRVLRPGWIRQHKGSNLARFVPCGGRTELIQRMPRELRACIQSGAETTLVVCADVDHDTPDCDALREKFRREALSAGTSDSVRQMSPGKDHAFPTIEWSCRNWRRLVETMHDNA
jgi:hypothetical protein